jgi:hypothetical protein
MKPADALSALSETWAKMEVLREKLLASKKPIGSFTAQEYMAKFNVKRSAAKDQLAEMVKGGRLIVQKFLLRNDDGRVTVANVYIPK